MSVRPYIDKKTGLIVPNKFIIDFYPQGRKGKQVKQTVSDVYNATAKSMELQLRRQHSTIVPHDPKVIDLWADWTKDYTRDHATGTVQDINWAAIKLLAHFGNWHLSRLTPALFK